MGQRYVRHALFRYPHPNPDNEDYLKLVEAVAFRGDLVELSPEVEARADRLEALEPVGFEPGQPASDQPTNVVDLDVDPVEDEPGEDDPVLERPARTSPKAKWVAFAIANGADEAEAEASSKEDLIATYGS